MMMRNRTIGIILLLLTAISVSAQKAERDYIRKGNRAYKDSTYVNAEVNYRKAIDVNPKSAISMYNLGNTLMQQNKLQEAMEQFVAATKMEKDKGNLAQIYHNMGVIFHSGKDYAKAVEAYKESLRNNPKDNETRYNLALAQKMLKDQEQNQQNDHRHRQIVEQPEGQKQSLDQQRNTSRQKTDQQENGRDTEQQQPQKQQSHNGCTGESQSDHDECLLFMASSYHPVVKQAEKDH